MPLPIIMAALETAELVATARVGAAAASQISRAANVAKGLERTFKTARAPKMADEMRNARRRFSREAERYLKMSENATGALKERYETLAKGSLEKALQTYSEATPKSKYAKEVRSLMHDLDINDVANTRRSAQSIIRESKNALASAKTEIATRRAQEAKSILSSNVGSRIYGATVNVWKGKTEYADRNRALMDYFGVDDEMGIVEKFEQEFGEDLYADKEKIEKYDEIVTAGQAQFTV